MNIAILLFGIGTIANPSGTEKVFVNMSNAFAKRGANVYAVWNDKPGIVPAFPLADRVHQINLNLGKIQVPFIYKVMREAAKGLHLNTVNRVDVYKTQKLVQSFKEKIGIKKIDVFVCYEFNSIMVANQLAKGEIPVVAICHNSVEDQIASLTPLQRKEASKVTLYEVLLPSFIDEAKKYLTTQVEAIPNTVPQVPDSMVTNLNAPKKIYTIVSIGRIDEHQKRPLKAVEAFSKIASEFPDWHLLLYGPATDKEYLRKIQDFIEKNHLQPQVKYMGVTQNPTEVLRKSDIFAFPSAYEGFGLALAEANTMGIPAIGYSYAPAVNELIKDGITGYLADTDDDFTNKLKVLMSDRKLRIRMGKEAHRAMKAYAPEVVWRKWAELLERLTGKTIAE